MPITTSIDRRLGIILTVAGSVLTDQEWICHHTDYRTWPEFDADFDQLLDFRPVEDCRLSPAIMCVTAKQPVFGPRSRQAFVATDNLTYGMCRMFEIMSAGHSLRIEVFRDMHAAREWLGLTPGPGPDAHGRRMTLRNGATDMDLRRPPVRRRPGAPTGQVD